MIIMLQILVALFLIILLVLGGAFFIFVIQYIIRFKFRTCKCCGHSMKYKGFKPDDNNGHYLFHCPKCGAREQISEEDFFKDMDKIVYNPNEPIL